MSQRQLDVDLGEPTRRFVYFADAKSFRADFGIGTMSRMPPSTLESAPSQLGLRGLGVHGLGVHCV